MINFLISFLKLNIVQMSQVHSVHLENLLESYVLSSEIKKSVVLIVAILSVNSTFWLGLKLKVKTWGFKVRILTENYIIISNNI